MSKIYSVKEQIEKLSDYSATDGLPEWEENFITNIVRTMQANNWSSICLSDKQVDKIDELFNRRIVRGIDDKSGSLFRR